MSELEFPTRSLGGRRHLWRHGEAKMPRSRSVSRAMLVLFVTSSMVASADLAPDATSAGPLEPPSADYPFPAAPDATGLAGRITEAPARLHRPSHPQCGPIPLA